MKWPWKRRLLLAFGLLVSALVGGAWYWSHATVSAERSNTYAFTEEEVGRLQEGDLVLRRGYGLVSDMIVTMLNEDFKLSHCGVIAEQKGELWVVHAVSNNLSDEDGMQAHRLQEFARQSHPGSIIICRLRTAEDRGSIARRAMHYLKRKVPFDHHFDLADTSSFYCSEMPWRIIKEEFGVDLFAGSMDEQKSYYRFSNFLDTAFFEVVLNHQE